MNTSNLHQISLLRTMHAEDTTVVSGQDLLPSNVSATMGRGGLGGCVYIRSHNKKQKILRNRYNEAQRMILMKMINNVFWSTFSWMIKQILNIFIPFSFTISLCYFFELFYKTPKHFVFLHVERTANKTQISITQKQKVYHFLI